MSVYTYPAAFAALGGSAIIQVMDVERLRLRGRVLAIAPAKSPVAERNQPQATTRWGADNSVADDWSARRLGAWWVWRAVLCVLPVGIYLVLDRIFGQFASWGGLIFPIWYGIAVQRKAVRRIKADLFELEASNRAGWQGF